jgi:hypothetical protein
MRVAFAVVALAFLIETARLVEARITWYLAVDQFGYLQFAHDLLQGKIFHDWEPARALGRLLPERTDLLMQTYVYDRGRMYCRYAPGFPMLLASWIAVFGDMRAAYLNPTVFLLFLGVVIAFEWRQNGSPWRGVIAASLIMLCPTQTYWWSLTLTRDLSVHLFAFTGLFLLLPAHGRHLGWRRALAAATALGFAVSIRNDAVLYLIPATLLLAVRWMREQRVRAQVFRIAGGAALGFVVGVLPTLAYNAAATGNPFRPTQGMEIQNLFQSAPAPAAAGGPRIGYPSSLWHGGTAAQVQGGGLKLSNVPLTLRSYGTRLQGEYGMSLLALAGVGIVTALVRRPLIVLLAVPYCVAALLFYSGWVRTDGRYIIGVYTFINILITEGVLGPIELVRVLMRRAGEAPARGFAVVLAVVGVALTIVASPAVMSAPAVGRVVLATLWWLLPLATTVGLMGAALGPRRRVTAVVAPLLATALVGELAYVVATGVQSRAAFQYGQMVTARQTLRDTVEPRSIVITTEDIGRPAENIEHYGGVYALYLTDLERWHVSIGHAALSFIWDDLRPYLLIPASFSTRAQLLADLKANNLVADRIQVIPPTRNMAYFVASPGGNAQPLELYRVSYPGAEEIMRADPRLRPRLEPPTR